MKKLSCLLLAVGLLLTGLVGCGSEKDATSTTTTIGNVADSTTTEDIRGDDVTTTTVSTTKEKTHTTAADKVNEDQGVTTIKLPFDTPITYSLFMTEHAAQPVKTSSPKWGNLTSKTNVTLDVDFASGSDAQTKLMLAAASGEMYDITALNITQLRTYKEVLFMDLTEKILAEQVPNYWNMVKNDPEIKNYTYNGKFRGLAQTHWGGYETVGMAPAIRYDVLEDNKLSVPKTWDEWFETMKNLKKAYPESTPFSGRTWGYIFYYWEYALGMRQDIHYDYDKDKYVCGAIEPEFYTVLQFMKDAYDEGIVDPKFMTVTEQTFSDGCQSNKIFFFIDNGMCYYKQTTELKKKDNDALIFAMPLMENSFKQKRGYAYTQSVNYQMQYALSAQAKEPEKLLAFMNWCYSEEGMLVNTYGRKDVDYKVNKDGQPYIPESVWSKYGYGSSGEYARMSDLGLGQSCFAPTFLQQAMIRENYPETEEAYDGMDAQEITKADLKAGNFDPLPSVAPDVGVKTLSCADTINSYIHTNVSKFITGKRAMSEFNNFVAEVKERGAESIVAEYNKAKLAGQ